MKAKNEGVALTRLVLNRYNCSYNERSEEIVQKSQALKPLVDKIINGMNPCANKLESNEKWSHISSKEDYETIVESLNVRGIRESVLNTRLQNAKTKILNDFEEGCKETANKIKSNNVSKNEDSDDIDKSLFSTMDDYIEGNLRDSLLEIEERLWLGNIGIIKCDDRPQWRTGIPFFFLFTVSQNYNTTLQDYLQIMIYFFIWLLKLHH